MGGGEASGTARLNLFKFDVAPTVEDAKDYDLSMFHAEDNRCAAFVSHASQVTFAVDHGPSVREQVKTLKEISHPPT
ncbi:hypothetical protein SAMN05421890_4119 [Ensifer adhaerens]|nr:hypothetical protein SAMN05421890_4119 [Ensifer adhaerens]